MSSVVVMLVGLVLRLRELEVRVGLIWVLEREKVELVGSVEEEVVDSVDSIDEEVGDSVDSVDKEVGDSVDDDDPADVDDSVDEDVVDSVDEEVGDSVDDDVVGEADEDVVDKVEEVVEMDEDVVDGGSRVVLVVEGVVEGVRVRVLVNSLISANQASIPFSSSSSSLLSADLEADSLVPFWESSRGSSTRAEPAAGSSRVILSRSGHSTKGLRGCDGSFMWARHVWGLRAI